MPYSLQGKNRRGKKVQTEHTEKIHIDSIITFRQRMIKQTMTVKINMVHGPKHLTSFTYNWTQSYRDPPVIVICKNKQFKRVMMEEETGTNFKALSWFRSALNGTEDLLFSVILPGSERLQWGIASRKVSHNENGLSRCLLCGPVSVGRGAGRILSEKHLERFTAFFSTSVQHSTVPRKETNHWVQSLGTPVCSTKLGAFLNYSKRYSRQTKSHRQYYMLSKTHNHKRINNLKQILQWKVGGHINWKVIRISSLVV